ncbi:hypothetical protein SODALDRAFT_341602 [Sodiomyces alkalinus F11]|uniref:MPN domain-containing protein n=1 Tax=Sodiomyces alkalinus (strain CBS 110278 / VKM F-3762 / F11) TaxID=1314773 RepID=A0A3N2Q5G7_SODAK|nr:hypothetical protein SODALDRAFT_341602 [Sodiomyces alkalinus F11]ROT42019.1 hypothetical protein SODALDRAFT_341602 [Sodiomyces alkalinus F11]
MNGTSIPRPSRPTSSQELAAMAEDFQFQHTIPFKYWARSADTLYQEAGFAMEEGDYRKAYLMLWRHSILVLKHLNTHPEAKSPVNKIIAKPLRDRQSKEVFKRLEQLKPLIDREYEEWKSMTASQKQIEAERSHSRVRSYDSFSARDPTLSGKAKVLDVGDNQDLAIGLAQRDYQLRDARRRGTRQAGVTEELEMERRKGGTWDDWNVQDHKPPPESEHPLERKPEPKHEGSLPEGPINDIDEDEELRKQMEATRRWLDYNAVGEEEDTARVEDAFRHTMSPSSTTSSQSPTTGLKRTPSLPPPRLASRPYHYPSISRPKPLETERAHLDPRPAPLPPPLRPPKEAVAPTTHRLDSGPPERPRKEPEPAAAYKRLPSPTRAPRRPPKEQAAIEPPPKKERIAFRPAAYLENGDPIRPVFIPTRLKEEFLKIASDHTRKGLEMCGMLCGRPINNALFVSCLLIPEQKSTSDTCETENESGMLEYCINEDLLMLGWIHTHPTQTCFMSSRDLHTQAGYQVMMPESIAIVCAPRHEPSYGIFRLTNPPGLPHILQCTKTETFHMHDIDNIYTRASQPHGHVYHSDKLDFYVQDLRPETMRQV